MGKSSYCQAESGLGGSSFGAFGLSVLNRESIGQDQFNFGEQFRTHCVPWRIVKPIQEVAAGRGFSEPFVRLNAGAGEELFNLADRVQSFALPGAETEDTRGSNRPFP